MTDKERLAALRARVRQQVSESRLESRRRKKRDEEEIVVPISSETEEEDIPEMIELSTIDDVVNESSMRTLASALILIGSLLGVISGGLLLQGNPTDLLSSSMFESADRIDLSGIVLESESGEGLENVTINILDYESRTVLMSSQTNEYGRFHIKDVLRSKMIVQVLNENYTTVERTLTPDGSGIDPFTMTPGEGTVEEKVSEKTGEWSLEDAVTMSTVIGIGTILTGLIGVHAAIEARRGKRYRRTQYLAGVALFSRGLIIFGPAMILLGMMLLIDTKEEFESVAAKEVDQPVSDFD